MPTSNPESPNADNSAFQNIFESLPELYLLLSPDLTILAVSNAYLQATLAVRDDIVGKYVFDAFPENPDVPDANAVTNLRASLQQVLLSRQMHQMPLQHYDVPRPTHLGGGFETRYWLPRNTPVLDAKGQVEYIIHQVANVTDQEKARRRGEQNEALLQGLAHTSPVALWLTDASGAIIYVNQTWVEWTGKPLAEQMGQGWSFSIQKAEREHIAEKLHACIEARAVFQADFRICRTDGTVRWCLAEGVPRYLSDGSFAGYVVSGNDITRRKQAEEQLQLVSAELAAANQELLSVNQQLTHINSDLDNFIYMASHDLKAPIANIEGLLRILVNYFPQAGTGTKEVQHITNLMQGAIDRFKKTIGHLTDVTKLQKEFDAEVIYINLLEVIQEVLPDLEQLVQATHAQVKLDLKNCSAIPFTHKNLRSIVYNLISNGIKYGAPERRPLVRISCYEETENIVLTVQDNGAGLTEKQQEQLFTMFKRFHDHVEGSGIGLYMVKRMVENAGGKIVVKSTPGEGTTFFIYFSKHPNKLLPSH